VKTLKEDHESEVRMKIPTNKRKQMKLTRVPRHGGGGKKGAKRGLALVYRVREGVFGKGPSKKRSSTAARHEEMIA